MYVRASTSRRSRHEGGERARRSAHTTPIRPGGSCPSPLLPFAGGPDEDGTQFAHSFGTQRKWGAWHATIDLGSFEDGLIGQSFRPAGPKVVAADDCHWWSPRTRNRYFNVVDGAF